MSRRTISDALDEVAVQHAVLRDMMERCEVLADEVDVGTAGADALIDAVARLRIAFDEHNRFEEQLLRPLLVERGKLGGPGDVRIAAIVDDHVAQHRAVHAGLAAGPTAALRGVLLSLRDHLAAEERTLMARQPPRDDA